MLANAIDNYIFGNMHDEYYDMSYQEEIVCDVCDNVIDDNDVHSHYNQQWIKLNICGACYEENYGNIGQGAL